MQTPAVDKLLNSITEEMAASIEVIDTLQRQGYDHTFKLVGDKLMCIQSRHCYYPRDFQVDVLKKIDGFGYVYALNHHSNAFKGIFVVYLPPITDFLRAG